MAAKGPKDIGRSAPCQSEDYPPHLQKVWGYVGIAIRVYGQPIIFDPPPSLPIRAKSPPPGLLATTIPPKPEQLQKAIPKMIFRGSTLRNFHETI